MDASPETSDDRPQQTLLEEQRTVLGMIAGGDSLQNVLDYLVRFIERQSPGTRCSIMKLSEDRQRLHVGSAPSFPEAFRDAFDGMAIGPEAGSCGTAAYEGVPVLVEDAENDFRWKGFQDQVEQFDFRASWSVPILDSKDNLIGTFCMYRQEPGAPDPVHRQLMDIAIGAAGIAMEGAANEERLRTLVHGLKAVVDAADELIVCDDVDSLYLRAVELARERFGLERCSIFVKHEDTIRGTYGTTMDGKTSDEHANILPRDDRWNLVFERNRKDDPRWSVFEEDLYEWDGKQLQQAQKGWVALTQILDANLNVIGLLFNDSAISRKPLNRSLQEIVAVYCSLLGTVMQKKHAEERLRQIEESEKQLQQKLVRAERMESLGILAGGVAHDLNNILGPLVGYPDLILAALPGDSAIRDDILEIRSSAKRAAAEIQDLLTLARRGIVQTEPVDLNAIIVNYLNAPAHKELVRGRPDMTFRSELDPSVLPIRSSIPHLNQVVLNLVNNAFEATPEGGEVVLTTSCIYLDRPIAGYDAVEPGDYVVMRVSDTGAGMNEQDLEHIFEPFYTKKKLGRGGTGLGLAVVYGVVKDSNGYVDVKTSVNVGSEFILYFPVSREGVLEGNDGTLDIRGTETILVVDDVREQREMASRMLSSLGYRVHMAEHGHAAIAFLAEHHVDMIVLDMIMEDDFDGLDTYKAIVANRPDAKCIIASGYAETDRVKEAQSLGVGQYIKKPYTLERIGAAVRKELDR